MKPIYIATFHQSHFGKLMGMTVPQILDAAIRGACRQIGTEPAALDVGSVGAACNFSLNEQGLLAGLVASTPGMEGKPIEAVENACASGGQAVLSVIQKLQLGLGETGIAVGYEKMRDAEGRMDGKLIGKVLGYFSHPDERAGKVFVFPHIFAEVMRDYMQEWGVSERDLAAIAVQEYANAKYNPCAQMSKVQITIEQAMAIEGLNRYVVDGLPLKTYDCSQITDGYAALILATEEGLAKLGVAKSECVRIAGWGQATDPIRKDGRDVLRPGGRVSRDAGRVHDGGREAGGRQRRRGPRLLYRDGGDRHGGDRQGGAGTGRALLGGRQGGAGRRVRHQHVGRADRQGPSDRRHRDCHDRLGRAAVAREGARGDAGEESARRGYVQYRRADLRQRLHRAGRVAGGGLLYTPPHEHFEAEIPASGWGVGSGDSGRGGQKRQ